MTNKPKQTPYKTWKSVAAAIGIARQNVHKYAARYNWPRPPWTQSQLADARKQVNAARAAAPNDSTAGESKTAHLMFRGKLKFLSERIKKLEIENSVRTGRLVPRAEMIQARLEIVQAFKAAWDTLDSRAYELVGLDEENISRTIRGWANEFYEAIENAQGKKIEAGTTADQPAAS